MGDFNGGLFLLSIVFYFGFYFIFLSLFGTRALLVLVPFLFLMANIEAAFVMTFGGFVFTLGRAPFALISVSNDILSEKGEEKEAYKLVWACLLLQIAFFVSFLIYRGMTLLQGTEVVAFFSSMGVRVFLAGMAVFAVSSFLNILLFRKLRELTGGKLLWLRNNISTLVAQLLDSVLFVFLAFAGIFPLSALLSMIMTMYIVKTVLAFLDTGLIYYFTRKRSAPFEL